MASGSGISGLMFVLRGTAERAERGEGPTLSALYRPESLRAARRLVLTWLLALSWIPVLIVPLLVVLVWLPIVAVIVAIGTLLEPAWIGSPVRPWIAFSIPVAITGFAVTVVVLT